MVRFCRIRLETCKYGSACRVTRFRTARLLSANYNLYPYLVHNWIPNKSERDDLSKLEVGTCYGPIYVQGHQGRVVSESIGKLAIMFCGRSRDSIMNFIWLSASGRTHDRAALLMVMSTSAVELSGFNRQ